jgi:filamentous hemagglutinin family protein
MHKHASMNRTYRIVWSAARGAFVVAAETARGRSKSSRSISVPSGTALAFGMGLFGLSGLAAAQVVPATTVVPVPGKTNAYISPNGVPVVNINTANAAGVSHNQYTRYDVEKNGLVLNNGNSAVSARQSQLAGQVVSNVNLAAEAKVILNEVVSSNRSTLAGFTEVLGGKADVIVANPYGITCAGCGFINTDRVTLTTGTPNFGYDGSVAGFTVNRGDILINGGGLNATAQQILDLVTRSVKIDGQINMPADGTLGITTGTNQWSYATRAVTGSATGTDVQPSYAIDSSTLGGMYAGRIRLVATEAGVGVRMLGDAAASADDFTLTSAGKVVVQSKLSAERDLALTSTASGNDAIALTGASVSAKRKLDMTAASGGATLSGGLLVAGTDLTGILGSLADGASSSTDSDNNKRFAGGKLALNVTGDANLNGVSYGAGGALAGNVGSLAIGADGATLYAGTTLGLTADNGDLSLGTAAVRAADDLSLVATNGAISTAGGSAQGIQSTTGNLSLNASNGLSNAGTITADAGSVTARIDGTLSNSGTLHAGTTVDIADRNGSGSENLSNSGTLLADGNLTVQANDVTNSGATQGTTGTTLTAATLNNTGTFIASDTNGDAASFTLSNTFDNSGLLQGKGAMTVVASGDLNNSGQLFALSAANGGSAGALQISGTTITNSGTVDAGGTLLASANSTSGTTFSNTGAIQAASAMTLNAGAALSNSGTVIGDAGVTLSTGNGNFTASNSGRIQAGALLTVGNASHTASSLTNLNGGTLLGDQLDIKAGALSNAGTVQAASGTTVSGSTLTNTGNFLATTSDGADGSLSFTGAVDNQGTLQSAGGLTVSTSGTLTNSGKVIASGSSDNLNLTGTTLTNSGSIEAANALNLTATATSGTTVSNSGQIHAGGAMALASGGNVSNTSTGKMLADAMLAITTSQAAFSLANAGRIQSGTNMTVGGAGHLVTLNNQSSGVVFSGTTLNLTGGDLDNQGKITATSGTTMNVGSLTNGSGSNYNAVILGATGTGASTITASGALDNYGAIHSNDNLSMTAAGISNRSTGGLSSLAALSLTASGSNDIDNYGALYAGNALNLTASGGAITNRAGTGTMDSGGTITTNSADFTNNNTVVASGDITINATNSFTNETTISGTPITKTLGAVFDESIANSNQIASEAAFDYGSNVYVMTQDYWRQEQFVGITEDALAALPKAQILSTGTGSQLTVNYGGSGLNKIAVLSAPTINISGSGTFTNEDMSLLKRQFTRTWINVIDESSGDDDFVTWASIDPNRKSWDGNPNDCDGACNWDDWNPGSGWVRSDHIAGDNFPISLENWAKDRAIDGAVPKNAAVVKHIGAGIFASSFNFTHGTLNNVSSPAPADSSQVTVGTALGGSVSSKSATGASAGSAGSITSATGASANSKGNVTPDAPVPFGGLDLVLPTNPNGYFVVSKDPNSHYLVETNPLFDVGSNFVGSDYLSVRLGFKPDVVQKRLGDSNYEAYLIRQQLINQTGNNILKGYGDEATQMQRLMDQAVTQSKSLGLTFGQAPTSAQLASLNQDMVWMVETVVGGQKVLAPVVYLAASTRDMIDGGAVIAADNVNIDAKSVSNTGGTIKGDNTLAIRSQGDITNTSGTIKGGDVSLTSTEGSIKNETLAEGAGDNNQYSTVIGKTAGITATGKLNLDAAKDITVKGADVKADGDVSLAAGNNVTFDTIQDKTATTTYKKTGGLFSSGSETNNVITTTNIGSNLGAGGNLTIKSGKDTTIAGSKVKVGGSLDVDAGGDLNVISRQDTVESHSTSSSSGLGVGGGLYGTTTTTTDAFKGRNMASSIDVGGDANIKTDKTLTLQGSTLNVDGSAKIKADDVQVLAGQDVDRTTTTTTTTSFLKFDGASGKADAEADAGAHAGARSAADASNKDGKASASASASAEAGAEAGAGASASASAGVTLAETTTTHSTDYNMHSVGSAITVGKDLSVDSNKSITLQGANVEAGGDVDLKAKDINVMASQDVHTSSSKTTTTQIGLYVDSDNSASAGASAGAGAYAQASANADGKKLTAGANASAGASADAQANAQANSDTTIDVMRTSTTETNSLNITNTGSVIKSGGKMKVAASDTLTMQGSELNGEQGVSVMAKDMQFLAAEDVDVTTTKTTRTSAGLYVSGSAEAQAGVGASVEAQADAHGGNAGLLNQDSAQASLTGSASAHAGASAEAKAGFGLQAKHTSESSVEGSTTAVVSSIKSGSGDVERIADNKIVDVGTAIEAGGNFTQSATTIESHAAKNTTFSSSESQTDTARLGVYGKAEAGAEASATGSAGTGIGYLGGNGTGTEQKAGADAGASATVGIEASYEHEHNSSSSSSSEAVVSTIKAGGKVSSTSTGKTSFEGTQISGDGGVDLSAKEIDFKAAKNTETSSDNTTTGNASAHFGAGVAVGSHAPVEGGAEGGFTNDDGTASSSTAVVGSIQSGGKLNIKTQGDARFEGTDIESAGDAKIKAGGNLTFDAAHNTSTESANSSNAQVSAEFSKSGSKGGGDSESEMGLSAEGGFSKEKSSSSEAVTGSIKSGGKLTLSAGKDATFEGTAVEADGDTTISAGGNVNFNAARNTSSSESTEFSANASIGASSSTDSEKGESSTGKSGSLGVEAGYSKSTSSEAVTGSIATGGNLKIKSGGDANFEGTDIAAGGKAAVNAGGNVNFKAAENTSEEIGVSASVGVSGSNTTTSKTGGAAADKPAGAGAAAAAAGMPEKTAGTAGEGKEAAGAAEPSGPVTERERGGELGLEAGYSTSTERKGGSISTGKGLSITSGKDANFEGTKVDAKGDIAVAAKGDVNITTARSTSVGVGVSAGTEREAKTSTETPEGGSASNTTSVGIEGGVQISNEGSEFKSGGKVNIASGGKTALVDTKIDAKGGEQIDAKGGVERSSATNVDMTVKMSHTSKSETPEPEQEPKETPETPAAHGMAAMAAGLTPTKPAETQEAKPHATETKQEIKQETKQETKQEAKPEPSTHVTKNDVTKTENKPANTIVTKPDTVTKKPDTKTEDATKKTDPKTTAVTKKKADPKKKTATKKTPVKKTVAKSKAPAKKKPAWRP